MPLNKRIHIERPDELVRLHVAEPAPLGLFGLSIGCLLLMCVDFKFTSGKLMLIPWIFLLPAGLQLIAGSIDFLRHNVFGGTAFIGYSVFWFGLSSVYYFEIQHRNDSDLEEILPSEPLIRQHSVIVFIAYLVFSVILSVIALGINRILLSILVSIDITFFVLILHSFKPETVPSWLVAIALALVFMSSMYGFIAILLNKVAGGEVLPHGKAFINWMDYVMVDGVRSKALISKKGKVEMHETKKEKDSKYYSQIETEINDDDDVGILVC